MARLVLDQVSKVFARSPGGSVHALQRFSLEVHPGELLTLVGPSGSGKTTALRVIAGLERVSGGRVFIGERDVTPLPPETRGVGMVFQNGALFPHLTVAGNLALGLRLRRLATAEIERRVREAASLLGITDLLGRRPGELSGGERQRVALGRALVARPQVLLFDEPLAALDAPLRTQLRHEIRRLHRERGGTTLHVTHDQAEALALGDRVAVLRGGELQQVGPPLELLREPANLFVAGFLDQPPMNLIPGRLTSHAAGVEFRAGAPGAPDLQFRLPAPVAEAVREYQGREITLGLRASDWEIGGTAASTWDDVISAEVRLVEVTSAGSVLQVESSGRSLVIALPPGAAPAAGAGLPLRPRLEAALWFDPATGRRLEARSEPRL